MVISTLLTVAMLGFAPEASVGGIVRAIRMVAPQFGMAHQEKRPERPFRDTEASNRRTLQSARITIILEDGQDKAPGSQISVNVVSDVNGVEIPLASLDELGLGERWSIGGRSFYTYTLSAKSQIAYEQISGGALKTKLSWTPNGGDELAFNYRVVLEFAHNDDAPEILEQSSSSSISFDATRMSFTGF